LTSSWFFLSSPVIVTCVHVYTKFSVTKTKDLTRRSDIFKSWMINNKQNIPVISLISMDDLTEHFQVCSVRFLFFKIVQDSSHDFCCDVQVLLLDIFKTDLNSDFHFLKLLDKNSDSWFCDVVKTHLFLGRCKCRLLGLVEK